MRTLILFVLFTCSYFTLNGSGASCNSYCENNSFLSNIDVKMGYFFFSDSKMRRVYDKGGFDIQVSSTTEDLCDNLRIYGAIEYFQKSGRSIHSRQKTFFNAIPLSFGLQKSFELSEIPASLYLTVGPKYFFTWAQNNSSHISHHMHANNLGVFANIGGLYYFSRCLAFDAFGEYSYCHLRYHSGVRNSEGHGVDAGGFTFGGGLQYFF